MTRRQIFQQVQLIFSFAMIIMLLTTSVWSPLNSTDTIRRYSRPFEFDFIRWEINAIWKKALELSFGINHHLTIDQQRSVVQDYFSLLTQTKDMEQNLTRLYSEPGTKNADTIRTLEKDLSQVQKRLKHQSMLAEPVIQNQVSFAVSTLGITSIAAPFPPLVFKASRLPKQLIISPRDVIRQEKSISLMSDISLQEMTALEELVEENTNFSALVVPIGGISTYPSMIVQTTYLPNLLETVAHEWIHHHLMFRPLGMRYSASPELRTMNETTAGISDQEIMQETLLLFYPEYIQDESITPDSLQANITYHPAQSENNFNYSEVMYQTRIQVDEYLAQGKIEEAERYMELQRQVFWENGYQIRKLNQAYFSFYGAYADAPFSAAGSDPVGEDVRLLRKQQPNLASFIWKMSWMHNYRQLRFAARAF
jgi:hypothetical protein